MCPLMLFCFVCGDCCCGLVVVVVVFGINDSSSRPSFRALQNQRVMNITIFMYNQYFRLLCGIVVYE